VALFDIGSATKLLGFPNIREKLSASAKTEINYLIGCYYVAKDDRLYLCSGTSTGGFLVSHLSRNNLQPVVGLFDHTAHTEIVRDFLWLDGAILTAGEDSKLCLWGPPPPAGSNPSSNNPQSTHVGPSRSHTKQRRSGRGPYDNAERQKWKAKGRSRMAIDDESRDEKKI